MDTTRKTHEITDAVEREAQAASRLADMAEHVSFACPSFPCETAAAASLLRALGYRADSDWLHSVMRDGVEFDVKVIAGKRMWSAWACWHALAVLESRRRWMLHPHHMHKLSGPEMVALQAEAEGKSAFHDLDQFSVEQLVLLLEQAENPAVRQCLRVGLMAKLREGGLL